MHRILILALIAMFVLGCGGGGVTPDPGNNDPPNNDPPNELPRKTPDGFWQLTAQGEVPDGWPVSFRLLVHSGGVNDLAIDQMPSAIYDDLALPMLPPWDLFLGRLRRFERADHYIYYSVRDFARMPENPGDAWPEYYYCELYYDLARADGDDDWIAFQFPIPGDDYTYTRVVYDAAEDDTFGTGD